MPKYCQEKFERDTGEERNVYWRQDDHVHNTDMITRIEMKLGTKYGGVWSVRPNSFRSNLSSFTPGSENYDNL
jgi:hypothetical protein